jgi:hypothetical protein
MPEFEYRTKSMNAQAYAKLRWTVEPSLREKFFVVADALKIYIRD